ncbi:hydroxyproline-rich glycoprotein family protein [Striga asiatica]|uniref:Hydroxyproline-rich glycoprotein family protein n=1 Tax=Striga asiatica TaxID=4170 RepID=A0A5A7R8C9_STRAF|nr:hydroxyproline-rich glycoprotein family protein [Striga asiatica]
MGKGENERNLPSTTLDARGATPGAGSSNGCCLSCSRFQKLLSLRCVLVLVLGFGVLLSAVFWLPFFRFGRHEDLDLDYGGHNIVASFVLRKPASFLQDYRMQLEADIFDEMSFASTKVEIISLESSDNLNVTKVVFAVKSDVTTRSLIRASFLSMITRQSPLHLTESLFGDPMDFDVLKFRGGITVSPLEQKAFLMQNVQIIFNFTLNFSIDEILVNFEELRNQLNAGLHLAPSEGSTVASPITIQSQVLLAVGINPSTLRLKQLAQTITGSHSKNLGLNNTVFGHVKQVSLSSMLPAAISPSPSPSPSTSHNRGYVFGGESPASAPVPAPPPLPACHPPKHNRHSHVAPPHSPSPRESRPKGKYSPPPKRAPFHGASPPGGSNSPARSVYRAMPIVSLYRYLVLQLMGFAAGHIISPAFVVHQKMRSIIFSEGSKKNCSRRTMNFTELCFSELYPSPTSRWRNFAGESLCQMRISHGTSIQNPTNLKAHKRINASVAHLLRRQTPVIPRAHLYRLGLLHLRPEHRPRQLLQPRLLQIRAPVHVRRQPPQIDGNRGVTHPVVAPELLQIGFDTDADEIVAIAREELGEVEGEVGGVDELVDEAEPAGGDLEGGGGVIGAAGAVGPPLDVEADHPVAAVEGCDAGDPPGGHGGVVGDGGLDHVVEEFDVEDFGR